MNFTSNFEESWTVIGEEIDKISEDVHNHFQTRSTPYKIPYSVLHLQTFVYDMCVSKPPYHQKIYSKFKQYLEKHLGLYTNFSRDCNLIAQFNQIWRSYSSFLHAISKRIFCYLDRFFMAGTEQCKLVNAGYKIFAQQFLNQEMFKAIADSFIHNLGRKRDLLKSADRELLYFTDSLAILSIDALVSVKQIFFKQTEQFYLFKSNQYRSLTPFQYYNSVNNLSFFQKMLIKMSVSLTEEETLLFTGLFQKIMIESYTDIFLEHSEGFIKIIQTKNYSFMKLLTQIYCRFEGFQKIRKKYYEHLCSKGEKYVQSLIQSNNNEDLINKFYSFYNEELTLVTQGFDKQTQIFVSMSNALEKIINKFDSLPQILFGYSRKALDENKFAEKLEKIKIFFNVMTSKDQFIHLYERSLQDKIIGVNTFDYNHQKQFIRFIHELCGSQHTNKLQKKLEDYVESNVVVQHKYSNLLNYKILGLYFWEKRFQDQIAIKLNLVPTLSQIWEQFSLSYLGQQNKKRLALLPFESKLTLRVKLNKKYIDVHCNLLQACIFIYVSNLNNANLTDIAQNLNIQKSLLMTFISLTPLLEQNQQQINFKWDYYPQQFVLDMTSKIVYEQKFVKSVNQDRTILLQAHIVRFMKRRKESTFEEIFEEISKKIQIFKPLPTIVKNTIDKLIKKDYLQESQKGVITYKQ